MYKHTKPLITLTFAALSACVVVACSDDSATSNRVSTGNPLDPTVGNPPPPATDGGTRQGPGTDGGCPSKPAGCFCGTPSTQKEFLNRCTTAAALPVTLTPKAATTADIP